MMPPAATVPSACALSGDHAPEPGTLYGAAPNKETELLTLETSPWVERRATGHSMRSV